MGAEQQPSSLLPGLPDDIALDCLLRVPYSSHSGLRCVCRQWRDLLTSPFFYQQRRNSGAAESLVCLIQALVAEEEGDGAGEHAVGGPGDGGGAVDKAQAKNSRCGAGPVYGLSLYNATLREWRRLPSKGYAVPLFAQCAAVQASGKLVLLGGWDPVTFDSVRDVWVVDLVTGRRRRGAPMPAARSFFACAAVGPLVYVAGGHDNQKNALRSAEAYDPEADEWRSLPPMADERDECQGVAHGGCFWVISGYGTDSQGRFDRAAECYDPSTGLWSKEEGLWGEDDEPGGPAPPRSSCFVLPPPLAADRDRRQEGKLCHLDCHGERRGIREYDPKERKWKAVDGVPECLKSSPCAAPVAGSGELLVMGSDEEQRHGAWVMEAATRRWTRVETPTGFTGFAFSAASVLV
ncbi:hypothetical protein Taro_053781 [Colocasia esculenta]|uniref:F-box domain-containing protein n=1 Tax=Colocasia esculenta TaxID=4460 RepID=A0A843XM22_COLES|nr:hypothetical protein [Colocasia esculenta]